MSIENQNPGQRLRAIENTGGPVASHRSQELMPDAKGQEDRPWSGGVNPQLLDEARLTSEQRGTLRQGKSIRLTPVQARARESLGGIDSHIAQITRDNNSRVSANRRVNSSNVEILREAVRHDIKIPAAASIPELVVEVGQMMKDLLDTPGTVDRSVQVIERRGRHGKIVSATEFKGTGLTEIESMAARGERAVLAHLAGQAAFAIAQRRDILVAEVTRRAAEVPVKLAQIDAIGKVLDVIGSGVLASNHVQEKTETYLPQKRGLFSRKGGDHPVQVTQRRQDRHGMAPGTKVGLKIYPDLPTVIHPSKAAGAFAFAGGKNAQACSESMGGHGIAKARGDNGAVAMSASSEMGGAWLNGGGGMSISLSGGEMPDFDL